MKRYEEIDILKGIAVLCMIIFHFFYFPNKYGFKEIEYDTTLLKTIAKIAQFIFIGSVGINLTLSKEKSKEKNINNKEFIKKSFKRISKLIFFAVLITISTYFIFGDRFVKFGILHFIAFASLLLFYIADNKNLVYILLTLSILVYYLTQKHENIFYSVPEKFAFVSGLYNNKFTSIDHFPIFPWIIVVLFGILIGHLIKENEPEIPKKIKDNLVFSSLGGIGKLSLEIYVVHWIVLYFIYCIIYSKYIRKNNASKLIDSTVSP